MFALFLVILEGVLALIPRLAVDSDHAQLSVGSAGAVICVGDSVTAGVGIPDGQSWPDHLSLLLARHDVTLLRAATPGAQIRDGLQRGEALVGELPEGVRPVVLVMLGHNDGLRWDPGARRGFERHRRIAEPGSSGGDAPWQPRLVRVLRWGWGAIQQDGPTVETGALEQLDVLLVPLLEAVAARDGEVVLLTYPVPGRPPADLDEELAAVIEASRLAQAGVNARIRRSAAAHQLALVDLEAAVSVGSQWDLADFVDHIHLSPQRSADVASVVYRRLLRAGALE